MRLSIGMIVKNEQKYLETCLNALTPILDEIDSELVIVDTGSTDKSIEIARKFTEKIYFEEWNNNFSEMRNISVSYSSGEWFFFIDADEIVENCNEIINFFNTGDYKNYESATIEIKSYSDNEDKTTYSVFSALRLFKKDNDFKFEGAIHEQPTFKEPAKRLGVTFEHYGYIYSDKELMERKFKRTSELLKNELLKDPNNIYNMFQLSATYSMHGDNVEAITEIERAYKYIKNNNINISDYIYVLQRLCINYFNLNYYLDAEKYALEWLNYREDVDIYFFLGFSQFKLSKEIEAIKNMEKYIKRVENFDAHLSNTTIVNYTLGNINDGYYILYQLYKSQQESEKAFINLLKIKNNKYDIEKEVVILCLTNKYYEGVKSYYNILIESQNNEKMQRFFLYIEKERLNLDVLERENLLKIFTKGNNSYAKLNYIRYKYKLKEKGVTEDIKNFIEEGVWDLQKDYFGDLLFYLIDLKENVANIFGNVSYKVLNNYLQYAVAGYEDFSERVFEYLIVHGKYEDFKSLKINKELLRYLILLNKIDVEKFKYAFHKYIELGIKYINIVYSPFILENNKYVEGRNEEEGFFIIMREAMHFKSLDERKYLQYLREALKVYPYMNKGIDLILQEMMENTEKESSNEMEIYKNKIKESISHLIELNHIDDVKVLIDEYEDIIKDDPEISSMKSIIAILENRLEDAREILTLALKRFVNNFDINYNLGYVYEKMNNYSQALVYYKSASNNCEDLDMKAMVDEKIVRIFDVNKMSYIGCEKEEAPMINNNIIKECSLANHNSCQTGEIIKDISKKLNLGCGRNILSDWINLDYIKLPGVDVVADLNRCAEIALPFEDNSIEEFFASHLIEHIENTLPLMQELHRIAKPEATAIFRCPYGSTDEAFEDPTHVRQYFINSFGYFSQPFYWRADYGYRGDWNVEKITLVVDKQKYQGKKVEEIMNDISIYRNVVLEMIIQLRAIKPIRQPKKELQLQPKIEISLI